MLYFSNVPAPTPGKPLDTKGLGLPAKSRVAELIERTSKLMMGGDPPPGRWRVTGGKFDSLQALSARSGITLETLKNPAGVRVKVERHLVEGDMLSDVRGITRDFVPGRSTKETVAFLSYLNRMVTANSNGKPVREGTEQVVYFVDWVAPLATPRTTDSFGT